jgi:hypothetical protein
MPMSGRRSQVADRHFEVDLVESDQGSDADH